MSTALKTQDRAALPALAMPEAELLAVLRTSLYPGAQDESIKLALNYCKAAGLDPMQKPVHLVPMYDSKTKRMRDVVMPGIGLYRTQAARSGQYAGVTEPEFGPDCTKVFAEETGYENKKRPAVTVEYPAWCKVTVKRRMDDGQLAEFAAIERWIENYATSGKDSKQPNAMWQRRPYAQLAKCAEAQALRKAFPEFGAQPTAEEMEGKTIDMGEVERIPAGNEPPPSKPELPPYQQAQFDANMPTWAQLIQAGRKTPEQIIAMVSSKYTLTDKQRELIESIGTEKPPIDAEFVKEMEAAQ